VSLCSTQAVHSSLQAGCHQAPHQPARYRSSHWWSMRIAARGRVAARPPGGRNGGFPGLSANAGPVLKAEVFNDKNSVSGIDCGFVTARHEDWLWQGLSESLRPVRYFRGRRL